jgi:hypothetical protein
MHAKQSEFPAREEKIATITKKTKFETDSQR